MEILVGYICCVVHVAHAKALNVEFDIELDNLICEVYM